MFMRDMDKATKFGWWKPVGFVVHEDIESSADAALISDDYRILNSKLHDENEKYGTSGHMRAKDVVSLCEKIGSWDVLDYGCGKGTLAKALTFKIAEYDPCIAGKDFTPNPADLVICSDVIEHIEPVSLDAVLLDLCRVIKRHGYFIIHTTAASKFLPDGRNAHLIQRSHEWWEWKISQFFRIEYSKKFNVEARFIVSPKQDEQELAA